VRTIGTDPGKRRGKPALFLDPRPARTTSTAARAAACCPGPTTRSPSGTRRPRGSFLHLSYVRACSMWSAFPRHGRPLTFPPLSPGAVPEPRRAATALPHDPFRRLELPGAGLNIDVSGNGFRGAAGGGRRRTWIRMAGPPSGRLRHEGMSPRQARPGGCLSSLDHRHSSHPQALFCFADGPVPIPEGPARIPPRAHPS